MVSNVVKGYHATIFAYGQTGSGKTYTMEGYKYQQDEKGTFSPQIDMAVKGDTLGLVQRCVGQLLTEVQEKRKNSQNRISVNISFLQLYNEKIFDLLNSDMF